MSILFRCDASREIGGGHVMRCLTLAHALSVRGCAVRFACAAGSARAVWALGVSGFPLVELEHPLDADEVLAKAGGGYHSVIVDHYGLSASYESVLRKAGKQIVVIDDLVDRPHDCDLLIDQSLGRLPSSYSGRVPPHADVLAGSSYALVRAEFAEARAAALARHRVASPGRRILVSLGLTDVGGISETVTRALLSRCSNADVDVVLGAMAPSRPKLEAIAAQNERLRIHVETACIAQLMIEADLAIGAAGTTSWERCCLALPTILLVLADNQVEVARRLQEAGAAVQAADATAAAEAAEALLASQEARARMAASAAALVDGCGTDRAVSHVLDSGDARHDRAHIEAAPVDRGHAEKIWLWRNDPQTRAASLTSAPILWEDHVRWFDRTLLDPSAVNLAVLSGGVPVGIVRFALLDDRTAALVSINLDPAMRGRGVGQPALACAIDRYERAPLADALVADIALDNAASVAIFEACGFRHTGSHGGDRFARYHRAVRR